MSNPGDRIFSREGSLNGGLEWFFSVRDGILGPFPSRSDAAYALIKYIKFCVETGFTGSRGNHGSSELKEVVIGVPPIWALMARRKAG
jgi:hypothetical protein